MRFGKNKVWTAVSADQSPIVDNGRVLIKYQLNQTHRYWVKASGVNELADVQPETAQAVETAARTRKAPSPARKIARNSEPPDGESTTQEAITIYTDGACSGNPGPAGIGVVLRYKGKRKEISRYIGLATNNVAELEAIRTALCAVKKRDYPVVLHSDSTYALGVLTKGWKARQNVDLVEEIRELIATFKRLRFVKVKGHAGNPDNELADRLAVQSIENARG
jgi:ribonuclease HI